ncbi:putative SCF ubiquitin ligase complex subunit SKP2 NDAI_0A07370 [Naumovozyma dairenensis CBS 421]|uniref:F-box domain-containing protein n=1 Tax=Naumovozyma dairenensis (strain ATCC 10597 / BCRC 20456 / CBS 421 / NBRC 0211 / NRRL Y-12639) TaxID=1071378 RepID=G0W503_NAUDC|nr:hypothetical protein NDAI_0A07370 [Naumovozyma dairenensis CBS 421]CCD22891.1 hypothetical protein NDAI_0A07370 [Naumovozyma dairenensis CBS 421]
MKRLQLLGRSKYLSLSSKEDNTSTSPLLKKNGFDDEKSGNLPRCSTSISNSKVVQEYPPLHLLKLPKKLLLLILQNLDTRTLLSLCEVNSTLYNIISNNFLYNHVVLDTKLSLLKFNAIIHSEFHTSNAINNNSNNNIVNNNKQDDTVSQNVRFLVRSIEFVNPQCQDSLFKYSKFHNKNDQTIAGSYVYESTSSLSTSSAMKNISNKNNIPTTIEEQPTSDSYNGNTNSPRKYNNNDIFCQSCFKTIDKMENKYSHYTYIELMLDIIDYLPNLTHVILSNVESNFKIPLWYSVFNDGSRDFFKKIIKGQQSINSNDLRTFEISKQFVSEYERKFYSLQRIKTLEIRASKDKKTGNNVVRLRPNLLCCFGIINELILENIIIDTESLDTPMEFLPLHLRLEPTGLYQLHAPFHALTLKSCSIIPGNGILKLFNPYFKCVKNLELLQITSKYDLLLCNCFSALTDLSIDCSSICFMNETLVDDEYYYENPPHNNEAILEHDCNSLSETLLDSTVDYTLQAPPATSSIVLSLNLKYISRTTTTDNNNNNLQNNRRKPATLTKSQGDFFKHSSIPEFHYFYHYYKLLWDRLPHKNININIINIPFRNVYPLSPIVFWEKMMNSLADNDIADQETLIGYRTDHNSTRSNVPVHGRNTHPTDNNEIDDHFHNDYYWNTSVRNCFKDCLSVLKNQNQQYHGLSVDETVNDMDDEIINNYQNFKYFKDIPNLNLWCFLKSLSKFKSVKIRLLRNLLFCTPRTRYDWELLLKPVLNVNVPVEVRDKDGFVLYSYGNINQK